MQEKKSSKENEIYQKPGNVSKMEKMQQETMPLSKNAWEKKLLKKCMQEKSRVRKMKSIKNLEMQAKWKRCNRKQCNLSKHAWEKRSLKTCMQERNRSQKKNASANNATFEKMHFGKIHMREKYKVWKMKIQTPGKNTTQCILSKKLHSAEKSQEKHDAGNEKWKDQWIKNWKHINMDHWVDVEIWTNTH